MSRDRCVHRGTRNRESGGRVTTTTTRGRRGARTGRRFFFKKKGRSNLTRGRPRLRLKSWSRQSRAGNQSEARKPGYVMNVDHFSRSATHIAADYRVFGQLALVQRSSSSYGSGESKMSFAWNSSTRFIVLYRQKSHCPPTIHRCRPLHLLKREGSPEYPRLRPPGKDIPPASETTREIHPS